MSLVRAYFQLRGAVLGATTQLASKAYREEFPSETWQEVDLHLNAILDCLGKIFKEEYKAMYRLQYLIPNYQPFNLIKEYEAQGKNPIQCKLLEDSFPVIEGYLPDEEGE